MSDSEILLYTPYLLTHCQVCPHAFGYINLAGYINKRVVNHIQTTISR